MFGLKRRKTKKNIIDGKMPLPEETQAENEVMYAKKKRWKIIIIAIYIPIAGIIQVILSFGMSYKIISVDDEVLKLIYNSVFLLLAFSTNARMALANLRDSNSLTNFRKSHYWLVLEYSTIMSVASLTICAFISVGELLTINHSPIVISIIITLFFLSLIYSTIGFISGRHASKYL